MRRLRLSFSSSRVHTPACCSGKHSARTCGNKVQQGFRVLRALRVFGLKGLLGLKGMLRATDGDVT
eukprot:2618439-Pyramimonas_sp.AAC.1